MAVSPYHLTSNGPRVNTLVIDMSNVPTRKTNMDLIVRIVHRNLKIQFSTVKSLQHNTGKSLVFLECETEEQALAAVELNDGKHEVMVDNVKYAVGVYMEDGATTVRVHDVSPQTENTVIEQALEKYGDVIWLKEETYTEPAILKGIKSGVRAVRIKLHTAIPSYINFRGEVSLITYKNQQQTCRHCNKPVHWGRKCMEVSYMELQLQTGVTGNISDRLRASGVNYAAALRAGSQSQASTSKGSGTGGNSMSTNFTNLNQMLQANTSGIPPADLLLQTNTETNTINTSPNLTLPIPAPASNKASVDQTVSDETESGTTDKVFVTPGLPLSIFFAGLISDDDMSENDKSRSRSVSPSIQKGSKRRGRSNNSSK